MLYINTNVSDGAYTNIEMENARGSKLNLNERLNEFDNKIQTVTFTAIANNTSLIPHNLPYVSITDDLQVYDLYNGSLLVLGEHYTENTTTSILLPDWSISLGQKIKFVLLKNTKQ